MTDLMQPEHPIQRVDEQGRRLCSAHTKSTGDLCCAPAMLGGTTCRLHGGSAPQTREAARRRLAEAADPAAQVLIQEATTATRSSDRIRASEAVLDRAGISRRDGTEALAEDYKTTMVHLFAEALDRAIQGLPNKDEARARFLTEIERIAEGDG